jgi:hypothetical protein
MAQQKDPRNHRAEKLRGPNIKTVTLCIVDCTHRQDLAKRALQLSTEQAYYGSVLHLSDSQGIRKREVLIPKIASKEDYSRFILRDLWRFIGTEHVLLVQSDGYVVNGAAWDPAWLEYDYVGAPWYPDGTVGNGGFSLRSRKLLAATRLANWANYHPEDHAICRTHRAKLEKDGIRFAPADVARRFSFEGNSGNVSPSLWDGSFGFHSWLTQLPALMDKPKIFHHSGDAGDIIYSLPVIKALGGGVLFISPDNKYPYPKNSRWALMGGDAAWVHNLIPLLEAQPCIWKASHTHALPMSTDHDLNKFREPWSRRTEADFYSIYSLHHLPWRLNADNQPWLTVPEPVVDQERPIVIHRSERYQNPDFPWAKLIGKHWAKMRIIGTVQELVAMKKFFPEGAAIPWCATSDALKLAQVVAGAKCCIMNQSLPLAIAHGLHKRVLVEEWPANPNCHLEREGAIYGNQSELPDSWL